MSEYLKRVAANQRKKQEKLTAQTSSNTSTGETNTRKSSSYLQRVADNQRAKQQKLASEVPTNRQASTSGATQQSTTQGKTYGPFKVTSAPKSFGTNVTEKTPDYALLMSNPDFEENSQYKSTQTGDAKLNSKIRLYNDTGYGDTLYDYINSNADAQAKQGVNDLAFGTTHEYLKDLPEDTVKVFNYLYATKGKDEAYDFINKSTDKKYTTAETFGLGAAQGTGAQSIATALGTAIGKLTGNDELVQNNKQNYTDYLLESQAAQQQHPIAYGTGNVGGSLALGYATGAATGAALKGATAAARGTALAAGNIAGTITIGGKIANIVSNPTVSRMATNALTFAATDALKNSGNVATGLTSGGSYAKSIGVSGLAGAAGGLAESLVGTGLAEVLRKNSLMTPFMEFVRATASSSASAFANIGVDYALSDEKPSNEEIATQLATAFALSMLQSGVSTYRTTTANKAKMQQAVDILQQKFSNVSQNWNAMSPEEHAAAAEEIAQYIRYTRESLNGVYIAGQQSTVNDLNKALDAIENCMASYVNGFANASASTTYAGNAIPGAAQTAETAEVQKQIEGAINEGLTTAQQNPTQPVTPTNGDTGNGATIAAGAAAATDTPKADTTDIPLPDGTVATISNETGEIVAEKPTETPAEAPADPYENVSTADLIGAFYGEGPLDVINQQAVKADAESGNLPAELENVNVDKDGNITEKPTEPTYDPGKQVEEFAKTVEKAGAKALTEMYSNGQDPTKYIAEMMKAYSAGKNDGDLATVSESFTTVSDPQAKAAYLAGQADAGKTVTEPTVKTGAYFSGEKNGLPFDVVFQTIPTSKPETVAPAAESGYNGSGYEQLAMRLESGNDRYTQDGREYTITRVASGYYADIRRTDDGAGYISNARSLLYRGGPFATREEAVSEVLAVAKSSFYRDKETPKATQPAEKKPSKRRNEKPKVEKPAESKPAEKPTESKPVEKPAETKPSENPIKQETASTPQQRLADEIKRSLEKGITFNSARLFEMADKAYGGTMAQGAYTVKDAYDGMELAINQVLMNSRYIKNANGDAAVAERTITRLQDMLSKIPTQTKRTAETESYQQFSTPPNIAYLAAWIANIDANDVALEPSAGIGGLALWPKAWGATVYANELSERRLAFLNQLGLDGTFNLNAEQINNMLPDNIKPTVVIMNPPFSATAGRTATNKTSNAIRHVEQALERLEEGGRLVAILGRGMENDSKTFRSWWDKLRTEYNVRANIRIDGENYKKYGTNFDIVLAVIDKTGPNTEPTITGTYQNLTDIPKLMEGIRNDRTRAQSNPAVASGAQSSTVSIPVEGDGKSSVSGASTAGSVRKQPTTGKPANVSNGVDSVAGNAELPANGVLPQGPAGSLQNADGGKGIRNNGQQTSAMDGGGKRPGGQTASAAGKRGVAAGSQRIKLVGDVPGERVKAENVNIESVYSTYMPKKVHIEGAKKHPSRLVESAAMAAVDPPDVTYTPALPERIAKEGILSDAQLENVVYAGQAHEQMLPGGKRKGYFIGDGTGVGKGRQIAGIIMDNFMQGRKKAVWLSINAPLLNDAQRDWKDLGGNQNDVFGLGKIKPGSAITQKDGILFASYNLLNDERRLKQISDWLGKDFDGVIAFDEAHKLGNALPMKAKRGAKKPSQTAVAGVNFQKAFPNARVIYASATGATEVAQFAFLDRLGLWGEGTAFTDVKDFVTKIGSGGLAAMELVARDMKAMGVYMARSISYDDVEYRTVSHELTPMQTEIYDTTSRAWQKVLQNVNEALKVTGGMQNGKERARTLGNLFNYQQRFYNQVLTSMSMPSVIADIEKELAAGHSCVIQLTNTNEAQENRAIEKNAAAGGDLDELDLTPSDMLIDYLEKSFPINVFEEYTDEDGRTQTRPVKDKNGNPVQDKKAIAMRDQLIAELRQMKVPDGPLEMLLDHFGVDNVAEVTGRSRRVVYKRDKSGNLKRTIENRSPAAGIADANAFQDGKKRILVFSDAGGTGRSYHADLRAKNQQQRVHYLLQPGWQAARAVQGLGRTHRSNQASAPIVKLVTTNVMGQKRFTSTIARRLDQLGALTKGQRETGSGVFNEMDNLENALASDALETFYKTADRSMLKKLGLYEMIFDRNGTIKENSDALRSTSTFLNRILSLEVEEQNEVFQSFFDTYYQMHENAKKNGTLDRGLESLKADKIEVKDSKVIRKDPSGADTTYMQLRVYTKPNLIPYSRLAARGKFQGLVKLKDGGVRAVYEVAPVTNPRTGEVQKCYRLDSPVAGKGNRYVESTFKEKTTAINKADWKQAWADETAKAPEYNEETKHLLTGTLLPIWNKLPSNSTRVMRIVTDDGQQFLGRIIDSDVIDAVLGQFNTKRTKETYTPAQLKDMVLKEGKQIILRDEKTKFIRRRSSGQQRIELVGNNILFYARRYPAIITEKINWDYRYFIPDNEQGVAVIESITKYNPVVDVRNGNDDVDASKTSATTYGGEWAAKRIADGEAEKPKTLSELVEQIRHDFGINITTGHIHGAGVRGQYNRKDKGIRTRIANNLPVIAHELGHHFDNLYGIRDSYPKDVQKELIDNLDAGVKDAYPEKKWATEGIAEWMRKYLQDKDQAAVDYPKFTEYFRKKVNFKEMALLDQLADDVNAYYALDADTATSSIRLREEKPADARTWGEKIKTKAHVLYQAWTDSNHAIRQLDKEYGTKVYKLATNAAYRDAVAGSIITGNLTDANGQYVAPGLKTVLKGLDLNDMEQYREFGEYLVVRHGPERLKEGMRVFADERKNNEAFMERRQAELESKYPEFEEIADRLYSFEKALLKTWAVDTGLVSQKSMDEWSERWKHYVPFNRAVSMERRGIGAKRGYVNQTSPIKRAHGSGLDIIHPVDNIIDQIVKFVNVGTLNRVGVRLAEEVQRVGVDASIIEKIPTEMHRTGVGTGELKEKLMSQLQDAGLDDRDLDSIESVVMGLDDILYQYSRGKAHGNVITIMRHGKPEFWKVNDPELLASLSGMSGKKLDGILDAYAIISRFMTSNITGNNVIWSIFSNFPRDLATFFTYSKEKNPAKVFSAMASAYVNKLKGDEADPLYLEYLAMGGGHMSAYSADRDLAKKAREELKSKKFSANPLDWIAFVSDMIESGPRFATYKMMRQNGMSPENAFYEAMDITVNFRRGGRVSREINKAVPFFNAGVQGTDKFARWISGEEASGKQRKKVVRSRAWAFFAVSAATGALQFALSCLGDDEEKEDYYQLSNYTKNSYFVIPLGDGKFFAIPKPRELAVFTSFVSASLEHASGNNHSFDEFYDYATDNFLPSILSDIAQIPTKGLLEASTTAIGSLGIIGTASYMSANRDFLGKPIVSQGLQNLESKDQYTEKTSKIAYWLGQAFNTSPVMIDYFFSATLGGWWKYQKALFPVGSENVDITLGVQNSYIKDNQYSTDLVNWLYDKAEASAAAKNSDTTNAKKAITYKMDDNMKTFYSRYYKQAKNAAETTETRSVRQMVLTMINEYRKAADDDYTTPAQDAVYAVCEKYGKTDYLPAVMQASIKDGNDVSHELSGTQYVEYQTDYLRLYWEYVEDKLDTSDSYSKQAAILTAAKDVAKSEATERALKRIGAAGTDYSNKYGDAKAKDIIEFKAETDLANDDGSLKQDEIIDILEIMIAGGLSYSDAYDLFHSRYDSDKNNPWKAYK